MSVFVDPLTLASNAGCSDEEDVPPASSEVVEDDEEDIFDTEGMTEVTKKEEDDDDELAGDIENLEVNQDPASKSVVDYILDDQQDLFITVDKPEKHILSMETYISYQLITKTTRSSFDDCEYMVRRRYQDFVWLRAKLEDSHPTHLIPPLPAKFIVKGMVDRFSTDFVGTRARALDSFLKRIAEHPVISCNDHLKIFLTSKDFAAHRKQSKPGLLSRVGGSVKSAASVGSSLRSRGHDPEFEEMLNHVTKFREQMAVTDRVAERLLTEENELVNDLKEYSPTYATWASTETQSLSLIMTSLSKGLESCTESAEKNAKNHELYFIPPLKEYQLYCDCIEQVFRRRDLMQAQRDRANDELKKKEEEKENLPKTDQSYSISAIMGRKADDVKLQKGERLNQQIEEVTKRYEELSDKLERANGDLRSDMERWRFNKKQDLKQVFTQLADSHITYQSQCLASWESLIPLMQGKVNFDDILGEQEVEEEEKTAVANDNAEES